jgi:hypothetical protein
MLIWILFAESICLNDAHEEVRVIAEEAMEELEKRDGKRNAGCTLLAGVTPSLSNHALMECRVSVFCSHADMRRYVLKSRLVNK